MIVHLLQLLLIACTSLKAVIGLPQGVFVSKNGQRPKTSILFFEKGNPTKQTWFYQVKNDGYTMGTNRRTQKGCQLVEALDIYHNYIKKGLVPPENKNSFMIDAEWIKSIDPRIKARIKKDVEASNNIKQENDITKKAAVLCRKVETKQIALAQMNAELKRQRDIWAMRIDAEIKKRINKAYSYSYNPMSYHSSFNKTQFDEWSKLTNRANHESITTLDERYIQLSICDAKDAFGVLSKFNVHNAVELDIVREYITNISRESLERYPTLKKIDSIFKMGAKYPMVKLGTYLIENKNKVKPCKSPDTRWRTLGVSNTDGIFLNEELTPEETNQSYYLVNKHEFCYNPYRINVGSIGLNRFDYDNH